MTDSPLVYNALGTPTAPVTLTAAFSGNRYVQLCEGFKRFRLEGAFVPGSGSTNQQARILVETSGDYGTESPANWYPITVDISGTTEIDVYADGGDGMGTASGIPIVIPGDKTSTAGTSVDFSTPNKDLCSRWIRISARDSGSANFGTLFVRLTLFPN